MFQALGKSTSWSERCDKENWNSIRWGTALSPPSRETEEGPQVRNGAAEKIYTRMGLANRTVGASVMK